MPRVLYLEFAIFIALVVFIKSSVIIPFDLFFTQVIQRFHPSWFDISMKLLSFIGNPEVSLSLALLAGLSLFKFKSGKYARDFLLLISLLTFLTVVLKIIVARPRPPADLIYQFIPELGKDSFPSFHAAIFLGIFGYLWNITKNKLARLVYLILILGMGISRVYLGEHWMSDVLGSYVLGLILLGFFTHYSAFRKQ